MCSHCVSTKRIQWCSQLARMPFPHFAAIVGSFAHPSGLHVNSVCKDLCQVTSLHGIFIHARCITLHLAAAAVTCLHIPEEADYGGKSQHNNQ